MHIGTTKWIMVHTFSLGVTTVQSLSRVLIFMSKRCKIKLTPTTWARAGDWTDASLATPLPPSIQLFHKSIPPIWFSYCMPQREYNQKSLNTVALGGHKKMRLYFLIGDLMVPSCDTCWMMCDQPKPKPPWPKPHQPKNGHSSKTRDTTAVPLPQRLPSFLSNRGEPSKRASHCQ